MERRIHTKKAVLHNDVLSRSSKFKRKRRKAVVGSLNDWLSQLPDEVLLLIISRLSYKDATKISLCSRKFKQLLRHCPILKFEDPNLFSRTFRRYKEVIAHERSRFITWVDRAVEQHLGVTIDELKVVFDLDNEFQFHLDKWVAFAFAKQVKRLELDFEYGNPRDAEYKLNIGSCLPVDFHCKCISGSMSPALRSLSLRRVNISSEAVEFFLTYFPFLEDLRIIKAANLTSIRTSSLIAVKHLEIVLCLTLNVIDVSAPNLLSFRYIGEPIEIHIRIAFLLSKVSIGRYFLELDLTTFALGLLSRYLSQLNYLELKIQLREEIDSKIHNPPRLVNLKHLALNIIANCRSTLLGWTPLIEACPALEKLTLKFLSVFSLSCRDCRSPSWRKIVKIDPCQLKCMKTLEILGFVGHNVDLGIATHVFNNAIVLEEVIVDTRSPCYTDRKPVVKALNNVVKLIEKLPQGVQLTLR